MMEESIMKCVTHKNASPHGKQRVYFTCHPDDFETYFQKVCDDIFRSHDPAIYYTPDMTATFDEINKDADIGRSNLFVIPVTYQLLTTRNRAMDHDFPYAMAHHIPVLPLMMETGIDQLYSRQDKFAELQYLDPFTTDYTKISYDEKLKKFLDAVLISDELAKRVRSAFDAYIFLSYRKKDRAYANKLIQMIHNHPELRDIAVWFDEFLSPGESFQENIEKILKDSKLFALLVTPNLLEEPGGKPNFVMAKEYPAALASGMKILPTEMEKTDKTELSKKFQNIPPCVQPEAEQETFKQLLAKSLTLAAKKQSDNTPEHNFLIGIAYLEGIDVEVDKDRGLKLITAAAYAGLSEALIKLRDMYREQITPGLYSYGAESWAQRTYEHMKKTCGDTHPDTLHALNIYADICRESGQQEKAFHLSEEAYRICRDMLGESHPETLSAMNIYAISSDAVLEFPWTIECCTRAYTRCRKHLGEENPIFITSVHNCATMYYHHKKYRKAVKFFEMAYERRCVVQGDEHPDTLQSLDSLADAYTKIRKHKKALKLREKEYPLYCKILGDTHPDTLKKLHHLAECCGKAGEKAKSLELFQKVYDLRREHLGEDDHETLSSLFLLGDAHYRCGKIGECFKLWAKHDLTWKSSWDDVYILRAIDYSALEQSDREEMKKLLELADSYEACGEKEKVLKTYQEVYERGRMVLGDASMFTQNILHILMTQCWKYRKIGKVITYYAIIYRNNFKILADTFRHSGK